MPKVGINHTVVQSGIYFFNTFLFSEHRTRPSNRQDCILFGLDGTSSPRKAKTKRLSSMIELWQLKHDETCTNIERQANFSDPPIPQLLTGSQKQSAMKDAKSSNSVPDIEKDGW